ncbi:MAG: hypothetical protein HY823_07015 [Acidobacteria bacterium]|nr:hypothetical protein [Acidobacteriota bacterium]
MRALFLSCALLAPLALPLAAQAPRFIKVDIVSKSLKHRHGNDGPNQVHIRLPLNLAKGVLETVSDQEFSIDGTVDEGGKARKVHKTQRLKVDQLVKLLESCKAGDMLLEVTTDKGDHVRIVVE